MDADLQRCYQPNLFRAIASMVVVAFAFALWVNSLGAPEDDVTVYGRPSFITANPLDRKIHIEGGGESGNKIGIFQAENYTQSGAGENPSVSYPEDVHLKELAPSNFESRLMNALKASLEPNKDHVSFPTYLDWNYSLKCPDSIGVYGYFLAYPDSAIFEIDSIHPNSELVRIVVERTFGRVAPVVSSPTLIPYAGLFVRGQDVINKSWQR